MKKELFIRFFNCKLNGHPTESHVVTGPPITKGLQIKLVACYAHEVIEWMEKHPNGKVDFVWVSGRA